jgi:hypothetical protein
MANGYTNEAKAEEAGNLLAKKLFTARGLPAATSTIKAPQVVLTEREVAVLCKAAFELGVQCAISALAKAEGGSES